MKTLFLDFDGVLHPSSGLNKKLFSKIYLLDDLVSEFSFEVVISSTWRLYYDMNYLKGSLGKIGEKVIGGTGDSVSEPYARYREIQEYVKLNSIRDWRALDDARQEFPSGEKRLIFCEPNLGVETKQLITLREWLSK